jgi:hypothetical protein
MNHTLFAKKCSRHDFDFERLQTKLFGTLWWLWAPTHVLTFQIEIPMTHSERQSTISRHNFTDIYDGVCVSRSWRTRILTLRLWVLLKYPWLTSSYNAVQNAMTVLTSLDEALAWCVSPLLLLIRHYFEIPFYDVMSPFQGYSQLCLHFEWRTHASWIVLKILTPILKWFKPCKYIAKTQGFIVVHSLQHFIKFLLAFYPV